MASFRRLPSGRWQAQIRRAGQSSLTRSFLKRQSALQWARSVEREIDQGVFVDRSEAFQTSVGQLIDRYLNEVTPGKKSAAKEARRLRLLKERFGRIAAGHVLPKDIASFRDERLAAGAAGATVIKDLNSLSHVFDVAVRDWGLPLAANPVRLVRRPQASRGRDRRLQGGEEAALLNACNKSRAALLGPLVVLALETAMRLGELLSLSWSNIDLERRVAVLPDTKNGEMRRVPLSQRALATLRSLPRHVDDRRVFWTWRRTDSVEGAWRRLTQEAGCPDLHFHDLRHEATSRFFERGLSLMEVAAITGHRTLQMLKRYTHLRAEELVARLG